MALPAQFGNTAPRPRFGTQQHTLSINGRLVLTDAIRATGLPAVMFALPGQTLSLVSEAAFHTMKHGKDFPLISGSAVTITSNEVCPTSGRVLIPIALRSWAGLTPRSEVAIVDLGDRVLLMLWSRFHYKQLLEAQALLEMLEARG